MTLEDILKDIELRGKTDLDGMSKYYDQKIADLRRKEDAQTRVLEEKYRKLTDEEKRSVERTILSSAEMESLKIVRSKESELLEEALGKAEIYVKELRNSPSYGKFLHRMVAIATAALGSDCVINVSKSDSGILKDVSNVKIKYQDVDPYGGLIALSSDGSREIDLTLMSIFADIREKIISRVSEHLGE